MREMKDSGIEWIGEIPKSWTITILSALFSERKCKNSGLAENNLLSLSYGNIVRKNIESNEGLLPASFETYNIIEPGNIVFRLTDLQNDKRSLRTGLCRERGIITSAYVTLQIRSDDSPRYMHYLFHTYDLCKVFYGMGDGVRQGMNYEDLKRLRILRPDQETQRRIADYLDRKCSQIDAIIARQQEVIEKLKAYKLSVITEAVTKGLNPDVPMKDSGDGFIGVMPEHWNVAKLGMLFDFLGGYAYNSDSYTSESDNQVIRIGNVKSGYMALENNPVYISDEIASATDKFRINPGSILFTMTGTKGKRDYFFTHLVTEEDCKGKKLFLNQRVGCFIPKESIDAGYYNYLLKDNRILDAIFVYETGTANQGNLGIESIRRTKVLLPSKEEQIQIREYLDDCCSRIKGLLTRKSEIISRLAEYKKSLIYEVVTGKKEV